MLIRDEILGLKPYAPGLSVEWVAARYNLSAKEIVKLASAENPLGASPAAERAIASAIARVSYYPEWTAADLREQLAADYGVEPDAIVVGAGETELIGLIIRAFSNPGDVIAMSSPSFPLYKQYGDAEQRRTELVPLVAPDFAFDPERYAASAGHARVAFLTTPNNPTGCPISADQALMVADTLSDTLVVIDEAYVHYSEYQDLSGVLGQRPNVALLRTFSKVYGLAGLRVGYMVGPVEVADAVRKIKPTWNIGALQVAGAIAALSDRTFVLETVHQIQDARRYFYQRLKEIPGVRAVPNSQANFVLVELLEERLSSTEVWERLLMRGVIVKDGSVDYIGLGSNYLRVDVPSRGAVDQFVEALASVFSGEG